jgi:hypothetical protein
MQHLAAGAAIASRYSPQSLQTGDVAGRAFRLMRQAAVNHGEQIRL